MSNGKGNPRTNYDISIHGAEVIRDTIKKNFKLDAFTDFKDHYISVSFDPSTKLDPKSIHFWVGKEGAKEIPDTEVLLGIWDKGHQLYSMDGLLMSGMNFAKESMDRPESYSGKKSSMASFKDCPEQYLGMKSSMASFKECVDSFKESIDRPERYSGKKGDLLDAFEGYILNHDEMVGAYKFNIIKYVTRFVEKNGVEDLDKAEVYIKRLKKFLKEEEA